MKIHEYNEMMAYLTRPGMKTGGTIGGGTIQGQNMGYRTGFSKLRPGSGGHNVGIGKDSPYYKSLDAKGKEIARHVYGTTDITDDQRLRIIRGETTMNTKPVKWKEGDISVKSKRGQAVTDVVFPNKKMEKEFIKDLKLRAKQPMKGVVDYGNSWFAEKYNISERQVKRAIPFLMNREKIKYIDAPKTESGYSQRATRQTLKTTSSILEEGRIATAKTKILKDLNLAKKVDTAHRVSKAHMARLGLQFDTDLMGMDSRIINQVILRPSEKKLDRLYSQQFKIFEQLKNNPTDELLKTQLDEINKQVKAIVKTTSGRLVGVTIDPNTLETSFEGLKKKYSLTQFMKENITMKDLEKFDYNSPQQQKFLTKTLNKAVDAEVKRGFVPNDFKKILSDKQSQEAILKYAKKRTPELIGKLKWAFKNPGSRQAMKLLSSPVFAIPAAGYLGYQAGFFGTPLQAAEAAEAAVMPQGSPGQLSEDEEGLGLGEMAAIGAGAAVAAKPAWKYVAKPALRAIGAPAVGLGFAGTTIAGNLAEGKNIADAVVDPLAGIELLLPEIYRQLGSNITPKNVLSKILSLQILDKFPYAAKVGLASKIVRGMTPVGVGLTVAGGLKDRAIAMGKEADRMSTLEGDEQEQAIEDYAAKDYKGFYNQGGRVGFKDGSPKSPGRRAFLKGITALAALPIVGRYFKLGKVLERASTYTGPAIEKIKGMPEWFPGLVKKLWNEGEDVTKQVSWKERQVVKRGTLEGGDDVDLVYDLDTGDVHISVTPTKGTHETTSGAYNKEYELDYKKGIADEGTGGKPADDFSVSEIEGAADPYAMDVNWEGKVTTVDDAMSDLTELEGFAKNKTIKQIHKKKGTKPKDVFPDYDPGDYDID